MKNLTFEPIAERVRLRKQPKPKQQTTLTNMKLAQLFSKTYRYIDDIASINNEMFSTPIPTLQNNEISVEATFLDTKISIINNKLISHYRILVKNINASIKQWNILSHVYRGSMEIHNKIFIVLYFD